MGSSQTGIYTADKIIYVPNSIMLHFLTKNFIKILAQYLRKLFLAAERRYSLGRGGRSEATETPVIYGIT